MVWPFTSPSFETTDKGRSVFNALNAYAVDYQQAIQDPNLSPEQRAEVEQTFQTVLNRVQNKIGPRMTDEAYWQTVNHLPALQQKGQAAPEPGIQEAWNPLEVGLVGGLSGPVTRGAARLATKTVGKPLLKSAATASESFLRPTATQLLNAATASSAGSESGVGVTGGTVGDIAGTAIAGALASKIPGVSPQQVKGLLGLAMKGGKEAVKYGAKTALPVAGPVIGSMLGHAGEQKVRTGDVDWNAAGIEGIASGIVPGYQAGRKVLGDVGAQIGRNMTFAGDAFLQNAGANELRRDARKVFHRPDLKEHGEAFDKVTRSGIKIPSVGEANDITGYLSAMTQEQKQRIRAKLKVAPRPQPRNLDLSPTQRNRFNEDMLDNFLADFPANKDVGHLIEWRKSLARIGRSTDDSILNDQINDLVRVVDSHIEKGLESAEAQSFIYNKARQAAGPNSPEWSQADPTGQPGPGVAGERTGSWEPMGRRARPGYMPSGLPEGPPPPQIQREILALPPGRPGMQDIGQRPREAHLPAVRGERLPMETPNWRPGQRPPPPEMPGGPPEPLPREWRSRPGFETYNPHGPGGEYAPRGLPQASAYDPHGPGGEYAPRGLPPGRRSTPMDDWNMGPAQVQDLYAKAKKGYWFFLAQEGLEDLVSQPRFTGFREGLQKGDYRRLDVNALLNTLEAPTGKLANDVVGRLTKEPGAYEELVAMLKRLRDQNLTMLRQRTPDNNSIIINPRRALIVAMLSPTGRALLEDAVVRGRGVIPNRELAHIVNMSRRAMGLTPEVEQTKELSRDTSQWKIRVR